jgi:hypothetical protein
MPITRTPMIDDDGSGKTGTVVNNSWKVELYDQIDAAIVAAAAPPTTGTWLPTLEGNTGPPTGQAYADRAGTWVKVGPLVFVSGRIALSAKGAVGGIKVAIGGLPFPCAAGGPIVIPFFLFLASAVGTIGGNVNAGASTAALYYTSAPATGVGDFPPALLTDTSYLIFGGSYVATS